VTAEILQLKYRNRNLRKGNKTRERHGECETIGNVSVVYGLMLEVTLGFRLEMGLLSIRSEIIGQTI